MSRSRDIDLTRLSLTCCQHIHTRHLARCTSWSSLVYGMVGTYEPGDCCCLSRAHGRHHELEPAHDLTCS